MSGALGGSLGCGSKGANETLVQQHGGQHAHESHVVAEADGPALRALGHQLAHGLRVEQAHIGQARRAEQLGHPVQRAALGEEAGAVWCTVRLLGAGADALGQQAMDRALEQVFFGQAHELVAWRQAVAELDDAVVEEGEAPFDGRGHGHAIAL